MLVFYQGITVGYRFPLTQPNGLPAETEGWSAKCQIRSAEDYHSKLLFEPTCFIDEESGIVVQYTAAESLEWKFKEGFYDIVLIDPEGVPRQIVDQGKIRVDKVVTNAT